MVKQIVLYAYHGTLLWNKKEQTIDIPNNSDESPDNYWMKKSIPKVYLLQNSIYILFFKWQNYKNWEQISGCLWIYLPMGVAINVQHERKFLMLMELSVPYFDIVNVNILVVILYSFFKMLPLEETRYRTRGICLYCFL